MTARTHDVAAITALGLVVLVWPVGEITLSTALLAILANQIGGIAPDIDQPTAPFWRNLPIGRFLGKTIDKLLGGHRFLSHSILGLVLFGFLAHWLLIFLQPIMPHVNISLVWRAFMIGMASHLVMDTLTKEGVPWLLPIPIKFGLPPLRALRVTTGKIGETGIFAVLVALDVWLCSTHYNSLVTFLHQHIAR
jgi:inner membrane protein